MKRRHALLLPMALAACAEPPAPLPGAPPIAYDFLPRLRLDVAQVEVENRAPPGGQADLGAQLRPNAAEAVQIMGRDRLAAFGTQGVARFIVTRAVVLREPTARQGGIFSSDPGERLSCHLACRLEVLGADGAPRGFTQAEVRRTAPSDSAAPARLRAAENLLRRANFELNAEFEFQLRRALRDLLVEGERAAPPSAGGVTRESI
jgi:hypothetical protein